MSNDQQLRQNEQDNLWREEMRIHVKSLNDRTSRILDLLEGPHIGTKEQKKGLIGIIDDHEERIEKLEKFKYAYTWFVRGMLVPTGYGIFEFLRNVIFKH